MVIDVIIPAYNEEQSISMVIGDIPKALVREVVVVDNNSTDQTARNAEQSGAVVLFESKQGYGAACLKGMEYLRSKSDLPEVVVFLDADYSDHPEEMKSLVEILVRDRLDMVIGFRDKKWREKGSMTPQQIVGNVIATILIKALYRFKYNDLGPFRAIRWEALQRLEMNDKTYGWTVEMQVKALNHKMKIGQVPVHYRKRKGVSKISGTIKGSVMAGVKIINTIIKYR